MMRKVLAGTLLLAACSILPEPKAARYRTVVLVATAADQGPPRAPVATVALRAVELPGYLDADAVVTRASEFELSYARGERWGEPLAQAVPRILAADLAPKLAAGGLELLPAGSLADRSIDVAIERFEADASGPAELRARWTLRDRAPGAEVRGGELRLVDDQGGPPAAGLSRLLGRLAEAIAADASRASAGNP